MTVRTWTLDWIQQAKLAFEGASMVCADVLNEDGWDWEGHEMLLRVSEQVFDLLGE